MFTYCNGMLMAASFYDDDDDDASFVFVLCKFNFYELQFYCSSLYNTD